MYQRNPDGLTWTKNSARGSEIDVKNGVSQMIVNKAGTIIYILTYGLYNLLIYRWNG
jgi:hypothetical protein